MRRYQPRLTEMDNEMLIEYVRKHEELYNPNHKYYSDVGYKDNVWWKIGLQFGRSGPDVKTKWVTIRDQFRKYLRKKYMRTDGKNKKWKYEDNLAFLIPYFKERERKSDVPDYDRKFLEEMLYQGDSFDGLNTQEQDNEEDIKPSVKRFKSDALLEPSVTITENASTSQRQDDKEFDNPTPEPRSECYYSYHKPSDPIDIFFDAMAATVKQLPPCIQVSAKSKIFAIVSELELQQVQGLSSNQSTTSKQEQTSEQLNDDSELPENA